MPRIMKSGTVSLSEDVFMIKEHQPSRPVVIRDEDGGELYLEEDTAVPFDSEEAAGMVIGKAAERARELMDNAARDAAALRENILQQAQQEAMELETQAYAEGLARGVQERRNEIDDCVHKLELAVGRIEGEQAGFMAEYEENLRWLAVEIASRVLNKRIADDETEMESLVKAAVATVKNAEWIRVEIAETMTGLIDKLTQTLKQSDGAKIQLRGVTEPVGTCVVDTPDGRTDASVYTQLANLKEYFAGGK